MHCAVLQCNVMCGAMQCTVMQCMRACMLCIHVLLLHAYACMCGCMHACLCMHVCNVCHVCMYACMHLCMLAGMLAGMLVWICNAYYMLICLFVGLPVPLFVCLFVCLHRFAADCAFSFCGWYAFQRLRNGSTRVCSSGFAGALCRLEAKRHALDVRSGRAERGEARA